MLPHIWGRARSTCLKFLCLFQGYPLFDYEVLSLPTNLGTVFSTLYCSFKNCSLVSSVLHGSHISRSTGRSSTARRYQIIWLKHSQACYRVAKKKKLNGIKIPITNRSSLYKENHIPGVKREFPFYQYCRQSLTFLWKTMTFFDTMVTQLRRVNGKKSGKKSLFIIPCNQNVKI